MLHDWPQQNKLKSQSYIKLVPTENSLMAFYGLGTQISIYWLVVYLFVKDWPVTNQSSSSISLYYYVFENEI